MPETELRHAYARLKHHPFAGRKEWEAHAKWLRRNAKVSLAMLPAPKRTAVRAKVFDRWQGPGFSCEKVFFESLPGLYVTGNLFRPAERSARRIPGVLCPHGHWEDGRLQDHDPLCSVIARCVQLARMGIVAFSYDMVGYVDSCQAPHKAFSEDALWGLSLMGLQTWNSVRALDFLVSLDEIDPRRLGVTGASGGASQALALMAVDDRIAAAAPICMISNLMQGGCLCENAPLLRLDGTTVDFARLFAPKPMFVGSCTGDWTKNTPREELPAIAEVYGAYGRRKSVSGLHVKEEHNYNQQLREAVCGFFNRHLLGARSARAVGEENFPRPPYPNRLVWWGRKRPPALSAGQLHAVWRKHIEASLRPHLRSSAAARKALGPLLPHVLAILPPTAAKTAADGPPRVRVCAEDGSLVVSAAAGMMSLPADLDFFATYNPTPFATAVQQVLAAVDASGGRVNLVGKGAAGLACLFATALSKRVRSCDVDLRGFDANEDASWRRRTGLPAIRRVGGLAGVLALVGSRPMKLRNAGAPTFRLARKFAR